MTQISQIVYETLLAKLKRAPTDDEFRAALTAAARRRAAVQTYRIG